MADTTIGFDSTNRDVLSLAEIEIIPAMIEAGVEEMRLRGVHVCACRHGSGKRSDGNKGSGQRERYRERQGAGDAGSVWGGLGRVLDVRFLGRRRAAN